MGNFSQLTKNQEKSMVECYHLFRFIITFASLLYMITEITTNSGIQ